MKEEQDTTQTSVKHELHKTKMEEQKMEKARRRQAHIDRQHTRKLPHYLLS